MVVGSLFLLRVDVWNFQVSSDGRRWELVITLLTPLSSQVINKKSICHEGSAVCVCMWGFFSALFHSRKPCFKPHARLAWSGDTWWQRSVLWVFSSHQRLQMETFFPGTRYPSGEFILLTSAWIACGVIYWQVAGWLFMWSNFLL